VQGHAQPLHRRDEADERTAKEDPRERLKALRAEFAAKAAQRGSQGVD
jgi:hypothetical protein